MHYTRELPLLLMVDIARDTVPITKCTDQYGHGMVCHTFSHRTSRVSWSVVRRGCNLGYTHDECADTTPIHRRSLANCWEPRRRSQETKPGCDVAAAAAAAAAQNRASCVLALQRSITAWDCAWPCSPLDTLLMEGCFLDFSNGRRIK